MPEVRSQTPVNVVETLQRIAQQLAQLAQSLGKLEDATDQAQELAKSAQMLETVSRDMRDNIRSNEEHLQLRSAILTELLRGGPALPLELAASILTFVEDIQPVLEELEREGLIQVRRVVGADVIELTPSGREEATRINLRLGIRP